MALTDDLRELMQRALWETENLMACIPEALWDKRYDGVPLWKYLYHTLYSLDRWYINPADPDYRDPAFHTATLADLNRDDPADHLERAAAVAYFQAIREKLEAYLAGLTDEQLSQCPAGCEFSRFRLIVGQFRHWHRHMGLIYGFLVADTGRWPLVLNQCGIAPPGEMPFYYE